MCVRACVCVRVCTCVWVGGEGGGWVGGRGEMDLMGNAAGER